MLAVTACDRDDTALPNRQNPGSPTPARLCQGRGTVIFSGKSNIKAQTIQNRRLIHLRKPA